jgi:hypothetical protein
MSSAENVERPEALKVPLALAQGSSSRERLLCLKRRFAGVLGQSSITVFNQGAYYFIAPDPGQTLNFPFGHGRDNEPRYRWEAQGEGVEYGYLVEGARA